MQSAINLMVGGEAGQGVQSVGFLLSKALARGGYHVFADQDYESRVRGGHNFFRIRAGEKKVEAISETLDILVALNRESIELHRGEVAGAGVIIYDGEKNEINPSDKKLFSVPLEKLAEKAGGSIMINTVAFGAALGLVAYDTAIMGEVLRHRFPKKAVADNNVKAATAGYKYAQKNYKGEFLRLNTISDIKRMLITGNDALALGAIAAGCKFMSAYPMTPASSIMEYFAAKSEEMGLVMVHAEDEIAAVNMAIGAGYAGVRAMTATSGSGFCLMVEGLGMAGITETPVVIVDAQRPGPAVGLPTRTEQGDLQFVLYAHQGDFPRAVLAPATVEDNFWMAVKAFNLAEKYQLPVIILTDHHLASSYATVDRFDHSKVVIERGTFFQRGKGRKEEYKRYKVTPSGVSPRALPGQKSVLVVADSDEHDEFGHMIEEAHIRTEQVQKRLRKIFGLKNDMELPQIYGHKKAEVTLIGWGGTCGAIREASDILNKDGIKVNVLQLNELWPFPGETVISALGNTNKAFVIESNAVGQLARLIRTETGKEVSKILKFDGRPFTPADIVQRIKKEVC
ncbi:2-oxoacid:acceptor oxidoreductase subunit alpha [Chloroflexota bacterium]